ncbi:uncharacterized protein [Dermacentor andersoni]|uniref:uncharacterized protein isoform X2 n=1 Tax=Dermacentor andersoni TaxID=34620 RepID=UPI002155A9C4|nr:uncharacterized protein LOC126547254 isoform X2 [Dermacentor andersoni]
MATWNEADWHDEAECDIAEEAARVAAQNSSLECDIDVSVTLARSNYTAAAKRSGPFADVPSEKSGLSLDEDSLLDGDLDRDFPPGDGVLIPGLSDLSLSPKHTIAADPLDLSLSEGDDTLGQQQSPSSKPLATIPEEPELEAQLEKEHPPERNPEELSTHMEEEPAPLVLNALPLQDPDLSTEAGNDMLPDSSEPHFRISEQSLAESAVLRPEMSDISLKEDKATSTADVIIEDLPARPKSPYQTRNRPQISAQVQLSPFPSPEKLAPPPAENRPVPPPLSQRSQQGARRKAATALAEAPNSRAVGAEAAPPVMAAKGSVANQFLEKIGQLRGPAVLSEGGHDTYTLAEDLMSIEGAQKQPDKYKKEDFGELFTKKSLNAAQLAPKLQSQTETEAESEDEDTSLDFDHLPIRRRMDIWKRREDRAIRKGLILIPKVGKQGRFAISAAGL